MKIRIFFRKCLIFLFRFFRSLMSNEEMSRKVSKEDSSNSDQLNGRE